jgi:hypothetical protein
MERRVFWFGLGLMIMRLMERFRLMRVLDENGDFYRVLHVKVED